MASRYDDYLRDPDQWFLAESVTRRVIVVEPTKEHPIVAIWRRLWGKPKPEPGGP